MFDVNLTLPVSSNTDVTLTYTTGSADTSDYTETTTTVTIPAGQTGATVSVPSIDDSIDESDEQFTITATLANGSTDNGTGTIVDNDTAGISISDASATEGSPLSFDVNLTVPSATDTTVTITTTTGTAGAADYTETNITVVIPAGQTGITVDVNSTADSIDENDEQFSITASTVNNGTATGTGTIIDNDTTAVTASIELEKTATINDGGNGIQEGDTIIYTFNVTNTGNVALTNVTVTDANAVVTGGPIATLAPGTSDAVTFTATHVITQADVAAGKVINQAVATGTTPNGNTITDNSDDPSNGTDVDPDGDGNPDDPTVTVLPFDFDPTGYFYCEDDGRIIPGGGIKVSGPLGSNSVIGVQNGIRIIADGSSGAFQWIALVPGDYTVEYIYPTANGVAPSVAHTVSPNTADVTALIDIDTNTTGVTIGIVKIGGAEVNSTNVISQPYGPIYYDMFTFENGDPFVTGNNIPMTNCILRDMPVAIDDGTINITHYGATVIDVLHNDTFGTDGPNQGEITIMSQPAHGMVSLDNHGTPNDPTDDVLIFEPEPNVPHVTDSFIYTITDANGDVSTATVTLNINCASTQTSDSGDTLGIISILMMLLMTIMTGLYFTRREERLREEV